MEANLVKIGNTTVMVLPDAVAEKMQSDNVASFDLTEEDGTYTLRPQAKHNLREGWNEQFAKAVAEDGDVPEEDILDFPNEFDEKEWKW